MIGLDAARYVVNLKDLSSKINTESDQAFKQSLPMVLEEFTLDSLPYDVVGI